MNSTVGLTALGLGCPVICLGRAIFDRPGLTFQGELDEFWASATAPDMGLFADFRRKLLVRSMINGDYYTPGGIRLAVANAIARFEAVGQGRADTVADGAAGVAVRERQSRTGFADRVPAPADTPQTIVAAVRH